MTKIDSWLASKSTYNFHDDVSLACVTQGSPQQPAILFLHGFTDSSRSWAGIADAFPHHRLILPDLRGHGQSFGPDSGYSIGDFVDDVRLLLAELEIDTCTVVGHSLGGMIAQCLAIRCFELVETLVLIGTSANPADGAEGLADALGGLTAPIDPDGAFMREWFTNPGEVDEAFLARMRHDAAQMSIPVLKQIAQTIAATDLRADLCDISARTLIIWGDQDPLFDFDNQDDLRRSIPGSRLCPLSGAGHNPHWEQPGQVVDLIHNALATEESCSPA